MCLQPLFVNNLTTEGSTKNYSIMYLVLKVRIVYKNV